MSKTLQIRSYNERRLSRSLLGLFPVLPPDMRNIPCSAKKLEGQKPGQSGCSTLCLPRRGLSMEKEVSLPLGNSSTGLDPGLIRPVSLGDKSAIRCSD